MPPRQRRIIVPLDDTAGEALAELSLWLGLGEDALAKRLLSGTLHVIAGALEARQESSQAPESEPEELTGLEVRRKIFGDDPREARNFQEDIVWPKPQ